ncbi:linear amide C-N hydrolase [Desulfosporosinus sp. FKB]|uniref:linear amide C-N hydrolase n=1 Tax=Desulfosporosinus sp. FKB TaxID=1969835 RepID=UPI000B49D0A3|nr:linear amide C-N hydrolase [Desulfosporosinus sp. FKB]
MCTYISIPKQSNGTVITARTEDWLIKLPSIVNFVPCGQSFPEIKGYVPQIHWENKYGFIGSGCKYERMPINYFDGLNEAGLSAASLWLGCSKFPEPKLDTPMLYNSNLLPYVLGNFKNIHEVEAALTKVTIISVNPGNLQHYIFSDTSGKHLIVEFINEKMRTYTTEMGVLTNDPQLDWQRTNLSLYENLSLENNPNLFCGAELSGSGQLGIPGDPTPQSRFIRAAFLRQTAFQPQNTQEAIGIARQILQTLAIPSGTVLNNGSITIYDWTQWSAFRDHTNRSYYFNTDFNSKIYCIHLNKLDFDVSKQRRINIDQPDWYEDISKTFESS